MMNGSAQHARTLFALLFLEVQGGNENTGPVTGPYSDDLYIDVSNVATAVKKIPSQSIPKPSHRSIFSKQKSSNGTTIRPFEKPSMQSQALMPGLTDVKR